MMKVEEAALQVIVVVEAVHFLSQHAAMENVKKGKHA